MKGSSIERDRQCSLLRSRIAELGASLFQNRSLEIPCDTHQLLQAGDAIYAALKTIEGYPAISISNMVLCIEKNRLEWQEACVQKSIAPNVDLSGGKCTLVQTRPEPIRVTKGKDCDHLLVSLPGAKKSKGAEKEYERVYEYKNWSSVALGKFYIETAIKPEEKKRILEIMSFPEEKRKGLISTLHIDDHQILQEYFPDGDLENWLAKGNNAQKLLDSGAWWRVGIDGITGIANLHSEGLAHGDVKLLNILYDQGRGPHTERAVLSDFGSTSRPLEDCNKEPKIQKRVGTTFFTPPEFWEGWNSDPCEQQSERVQKADVYSFGLALWTARNPGKKFPSESCRKQRFPVVCIETEVIALQLSLEKSRDPVDNLLARALRIKADLRPTSAEFREELLKHKPANLN